jgi:hypothetical protein
VDSEVDAKSDECTGNDNGCGDVFHGALICLVLRPEYLMGVRAGGAV